MGWDFRKNFEGLLKTELWIFNDIFWRPINHKNVNFSRIFFERLLELEIHFFRIIMERVLKNIFKETIRDYQTIRIVDFQRYFRQYYGTTNEDYLKFKIFLNTIGVRNFYCFKNILEEPHTCIL